MRSFVLMLVVVFACCGLIALSGQDQPGLSSYGMDEVTIRVPPKISLQGRLTVPHKPGLTEIKEGDSILRIYFEMPGEIHISGEGKDGKPLFPPTAGKLIWKEARTYEYHAFTVSGVTGSHRSFQAYTN